MPTFIDIEPALLKWQAKYGKRMTNEELAVKAGISIAALYRMKSGAMIAPDLRKINQICKVLECQPGELIKREPTGQLSAITELEAERMELLHEIEKKLKRTQQQEAKST